MIETVYNHLFEFASDSKDKIIELEASSDNYAKVVGKLTVENEWLSGKLVRSDLYDKKELIESELKTISVKRQCELIGLGRSSLYYEPVVNVTKSQSLQVLLDT